MVCNQYTYLIVLSGGGRLRRKKNYLASGKLGHPADRLWDVWIVRQHLIQVNICQYKDFSGLLGGGGLGCYAIFNITLIFDRPKISVVYCIIISN